MNKKIKFFDVNYFYNLYKNNILEAINKNLESGLYIRNDKELKFEYNIKKYFNCKYAYGLSSGTDALILSIKSLGLNNKKIIILDNTFVAQIEAILFTNNFPIVLDCNLKNFGFNLEKLEKNINEDIGAIIFTHIYGIPDDSLIKIKKIIKGKGIKIIEDCSHAFGSVLNGKKVGTFSDIGIFSLNPTKILGGIFDGAVIITNKKYIYENIKKISNHGRNNGRHIMPGFNSRLSILNSIYLDYKLKYIDNIIKKRKFNAFFYYEHLYKNNNINLIDKKYYKNISFYVFPIFLKDKNTRNNLKNFLIKNGIEVKVHYEKNITGNSCYKFYNKNDLNNSKKLCDTELSLPIGEYLIKSELLNIINIIFKFFKIEGKIK